MFARDFDNYAAVAKERQDEMLRASRGTSGRGPAWLWSVGVGLAVVCAPLAAIFFLRVW